MSKQVLRDVIVVLPGIGGSVLSRKGAAIWAPTPGCAYRMTGGAKALALADDSGDANQLADGVEATGMVNDIHVLPGLWKIDGYDTLVAALEERFHTVKAYPGQTKCANLVVFPYDWRRDNRITAKRLELVANDFLLRWRNGTFFKNAKLILIAHSMGGLISRQYLDVLGGWRDCSALFTFGTPFRGSLKALDALSNGVRKLAGLFDLSDTLRSMPSVYQLLPRYECVLYEKAYRRVCEIQSLPNIVRQRAQDARDFYTGIDAAVGGREGKLGYHIFPYAGIQQTTLQSAEADGAAVRVLEDCPPNIPTAFEEGDGTVPLASAIPAELSEKAEFVTHVNERHASLQANSTVLNDLLRRLIAMEVPGLSNVLGTVASESTLALKLDVPDIIAEREPSLVPLKIKGAPPDVTITATLESTQTRKADRVPVSPVDGCWQVELPALGAGSYRIEAQAQAKAGRAAVHDVFAVAER